MSAYVATLLQVCHHVSAAVPARSSEKVFLHMRSEFGELDEEINIACNDLPYKTPGPDGIPGEAADVITCIADLIWVCADPLENMAAYRDRIAERLSDVDFDAWEGSPPLRDVRADYIEATADLSSLANLTRGATIHHPDVLDLAAALLRHLLRVVKSHSPMLSEAEFLEVLEAKCAKWRQKAREA